VGNVDYTLHVLSGELEGTSVSVLGELVVGRSSSCDLFIPDRRMSRRHARFYREGRDLFIEDLQSHNGTFVNGKRVARMQLFRADVVRIGASQFEVALTELSTDPGHDTGQPTAHLIKPVTDVTSPDLDSMLAEDYFAALGLDGDAQRPRTAAELDFLLRQTRNFAVLHEVAKALQAGLERAAMLDRVLALVRKVLRADRGFVIRIDEQGSLQPLVVQTREGSSRSPTGQVRMSETVAEQVIRGRCGVITSDAAADERFSAAESVVLNDVRSLLAVPMLVGERVLGLIEVETTGMINGFSENDLDLMTVVASMVGAALQNLELAAQRERTIGELERAQRQLIEAQERLVRSEQMAAVGRIASGIAHEVKNHLAPLLLADMLRRQYPDDEDIQESTELMLEAQRRILSLVDEIRRFAMGTKSEIAMGLEDMSQVAASVIRFVRCDARVRAIVLDLEAPSSVIAEFDANRIRQVLINLIRNAADAVDPATGHVVVRVQAAAGQAIVEVQDNGRGIAPAEAARVFEPFFTTKGEHGLGLGLDISRAIVQAHGGELAHRPAPGGGTIFRITLPLEQPLDLD
jgi:signal transduction histidine kinase